MHAALKYLQPETEELLESQDDRILHQLFLSPEPKMGVERSPHSLMANVLDCDIIVSKFKLQLSYYIHFQTNALWERYEPFYSPSCELNITTIVLL